MNIVYVLNFSINKLNVLYSVGDSSISHKIIKRIKYLAAFYIWVILLVLSSFPLSAKISFQAEAVDSISHFRVIPIYLADDELQAFTRHSIEDSQGYIWSSGSAGLLRYGGYSNIAFDFQDSTKETDGGLPYLFNDSKGNFWVANTYLYRFNEFTGKFKAFDFGKKVHIISINEDLDGNLWLFNTKGDLFKFDQKLEQLTLTSFNNKALQNITSSVYEKSQGILWFTSKKGVYGLNLVSKKLIKVNTPLDKHFSNFMIRDIAIDESRRTLWVGTQKGALQINTQSLEVQLYTADKEVGSLPISEVTVTFVDSANNIWLGLEKAGLCVFKHTKGIFMCLNSSIEEEYKLPAATVEDISEDSNGNLWLAMNQYGMFRITPDLEKFVIMRDKITNSDKGYFRNSFNGVVRDNKDVWIATDGGGINIFNYETGAFSNIKQDPNNTSSLSSNSVISLVEDEKGYIWASTWGGGVSKINPDTLMIRPYLNSPNMPKNKTIAGNNVFSMVPDMRGGIWLSIWGKGVQYLNIKENLFTSYIYEEENSASTITNTLISDLKLYDEKLWITGQAGLEVLDIKTEKFKVVLPADIYGFTFVFIDTLEEIWIGTSNGLIHFNSITGEKHDYTSEDGLVNNDISYIRKGNDNKLWVATSNGLSVLDVTTNQFINFTKKDGMAGNQLSTHGDFIDVDNLLYVPSKSGVTIINPNEMPMNTNSPKIVISDIELLNSNKLSVNTSLDNPVELPIDSNNIKFEFFALNFVFPEYNQYKYRLIGLQSDFVSTKANERFARFTNLPAGTYTFEVYGSNGSGMWSEQSDRFTFTILPAWWSTWWAYFLFTILFLFLVYITYKWRFSLIVKREHTLNRLVQEKTHQLQTYAGELKSASQSLANLNNELENRVEKRTEQLQLEINERKVAESKLFHMAFHDSLTGLPNREWIIKLINELLTRSKEDSGFYFGVMFLDGDRFKQVNDTLGHIIGDQLLKSASKRLSALLNNDQYVGRLGGDEFTVIAELNNDSSFEALAQDIINAFKKPFTLEHHTLYFNMSIGIVECNYTYTEVLEILRNADIAMYRAKELGRGNYQLFDKQMQEKTLDQAELEANLRVAIQQNEFHLVYQPIINIETGVLSGFESLLRWQHPEKGLISPLTFISIAEETGLIWDIGSWVLHESCQQAKQWHDLGLAFQPTISVNLSTNQIRNVDFLSMLDEVIEETGFNPEYLKLELTESVLIENSQELNVLYKALHERKIDLAIDDFGTGYSSLAYLNEIPVQFLKIDRCFVEAIDKNADGEVHQDALEVVKAIISLSKSLRKQVVAEGIETQTQLRSLIEIGCDFVQGYFLSKPVSEKNATNLLMSNKVTCEGGVNIPKQKYVKEYNKRSIIDL